MDEKKSEKIKFEIAKKYKKALHGLPLDILFQNNSLHKESESIKEKIQKEYSDYKTRHKLFDFDDLILRLIELGRIKGFSKIRKSFGLVVVDEFQDSGKLEMDFLQLLNPKRLIVVGDDWQSIYGFRRADLEYTKNFNNYFPESRKFFLTQNYRSSSSIIKVSSETIRRCPGLIKKKIKAHKAAGPKPVLGLLPSSDKLKYVLKEISSWLSKNNSGHTAVLSRTNRQSNLLKKSFENSPSANKVEFMTIHQAKGLEFDNVIIAPMDNKSLPHPDANPYEEMRLLYVACSRAKKNLLLLASAGKNKSFFLSFFKRGIKKIYLLDSKKIKKILEKNWGISSAG